LENGSKPRVCFRRIYLLYIEKRKNNGFKKINGRH
jgi:hypothetical protein